MFMITHIVTHMTVGLSIAGWGGAGSRWRRLLGAFRFPYVYAVGLAFLLRAARRSRCPPPLRDRSNSSETCGSR